MGRSGSAWLLLVPVAALVAGCVDGPYGPPVSATTVPADAPSEAGSGDYGLRITIIDEPGGPRLPEAAVVVYWGDFDGSGSDVALDLRAQARGSDGSAYVVVRAADPVGTPAPDTVLSMRTDASGVALARVPPNRVVGVVAWAPDHTEEWIAAAVTGADGALGDLSLPLFRARLDRLIEDTWGPGAASPGKLTGQAYAWRPEPVPWGATEEARAGYLHRLASVELELTWNNLGDLAAGDLAIAAGTTDADPERIWDSDVPQMGPGVQSESAQLDLDLVNELAWAHRDGLFVGPATGTAFAGPLGLPFQLEMNATFDAFLYPFSWETNDSPLPGFVVPLALVVAALGCGARRRA